LKCRTSTAGLPLVAAGAVGFRTERLTLGAGISGSELRAVLIQIFQ
jgi:hypothetical protein